MLNSLTGQKNNKDHTSLIPLFPWCLTVVSGFRISRRTANITAGGRKEGCIFCAKGNMTSLNSLPGRDILNFCLTKRAAFS